MDRCDKEALDWTASTGSYDSDIKQEVMMYSFESHLRARCRHHQWNG